MQDYMSIYACMYTKGVNLGGGGGVGVCLDTSPHFLDNENYSSYLIIIYIYI